MYNKRPKSDNRMSWILQMEECNKPNIKNIYHTEYEICSEVRIPGPLEYNNKAILCRLIEEKNKEGLYTYLLRVKHVEKEYEFNEDQYSKEGYFFPEGPIGELLALFSVFFQARFYLKTSCISESIRYRHEFNYRKPNKFLNYEMFTNQNRNWCRENKLEKFLNIIKSIDGKYHQSFIRSFGWYSKAIKEIGIDDELFFIKMTSCIEALLKFIKIDEDNLEKKIRSLINDNYFGNEYKSEVKNWLHNRKIGYRFLSFISQYSSGFFKCGTRKPKHCYIFKPDLNKFTKSIYNARSKYLHEGKPMYLSMEMLNDSYKDFDLDGTSNKMADRRKFNDKEKLPRMRWFERITNHCLKNFINQISIK